MGEGEALVVVGNPRENDSVQFLLEDYFDASQPLHRDDALKERRLNDPMLDVASAQLYIQEMESLRGQRPSEKIRVADGQGGTTEMTVGQRIEQLPALINRDFESAIAKADGKDFLKAAALLIAIDAAMPKAVSQLDPRGMDARSVRRMLPDTLHQLSREELQILKWQTEMLIRAPYLVRAQYAGVLADQGELPKARKMIDESVLNGGSSDPLIMGLKDDVDFRLKRREVAGGEDPMELARLGARALSYGNMEKAATLFERARVLADGLKSEKLKERLGQISTEARDPHLSADKRRELAVEKRCLEELLHAPAAVRFSEVGLAAAQGQFAKARWLVESAGALDPHFAADNYGQYLDMLVFATSAGKDNSVFAFHNHLVSFQRHLSPRAFNLDAARDDLRRAEEEVKKLPFEQIKEMKKLQGEKLKQLADAAAKAASDSEKAQAQAKVEETKTALEGLDLLEHAPAYTRLMQGIFELANKNNARALEIFNEVEKMDPEYAAKSTTQLEQLRKFAMQPLEAKEEQSWLKGLLKELMYSAAAIAAGAIVVIATGWSGPAALAAGAAAGMAVRSGFKYAVEGEVEWYDPVIGAVDGLSGGAGVLVRRAAINGLSQTAKVMTAAERALVATGADTVALEGLTGAERALTAQTIARKGLSDMGARLPWYTRLATKLPFVTGDPAYGLALKEVGRLASINARNVFVADLAGGAAVSLTHRGRIYAPQVANGKYQDFGSFAADYFGAVADDALFSGLGGQIVPAFLPGRMFGPNMTPVLYGGRAAVWDYPNTRVRLEEIDRIIADLEAPSNPKQVREWYFKMPGPKVELNPRR